MSYSLCWNGRFWKVDVPICVTHAWTYVQAYVASGGSVAAGMRAAVSAAYPGVGWADSIGGSKECGRPLSVAVFGPEIGAELGTSFRAFSEHTHSQMRTHPASSRSNTNAASGTSVNHKPSPQSATSIASRHHDLPARGADHASQTRVPKPTATGRTGGWLGKGPTTQPGAAGGSRA